ncbi:hypothetical protein CCACVL1_17397 [Corchorus capsularis]|uniref:DUF4283 domain-containing protein n=1 Tax=Corchorus capsularis TaxID=210143 RepID=A0A1R3HS40_COCAP|nr:hypothetical protein CCACVL1_17397 [Corchorus capsularis]
MDEEERGRRLLGFSPPNLQLNNISYENKNFHTKSSPKVAIYSGETKVLGKTVGYNFLLNRLKQIWDLKEEFSLVDFGNEYFLVRVRNPDDYNQVMSKGPWLVAGHYLTIRRWKPLFRPYQVAIRTTAVWVRFLRLPIEFFNRSKLVAARNLIGKTVKVDKPTENSARGKYARVCVEVDLGKALVGQIMIGTVWLRVEYKGLDEIYFDCGIYGHKTSYCHQRIFKESHKATEMEESLADPKEKSEQANHDGENVASPYGPWMVAQRKPRRNNGSKTNSQSSKVHGKSDRGNNMEDVSTPN